MSGGLPIRLTGQSGEDIAGKLQQPVAGDGRDAPAHEVDPQAVRGAVPVGHSINDAAVVNFSFAQSRPARSADAARANCPSVPGTGPVQPGHGDRSSSDSGGVSLPQTRSSTRRRQLRLTTAYPGGG